MMLCGLEIAGSVEPHEHGGNLEKRIRGAIEAARLDVDDDRHEAAEARRERSRRRFGGRRCGFFVTHASSLFLRSSAPLVVRVSSSTVSRTPNPVISVGT